MWYNILHKVNQDKTAQAKAERKAKFLQNSHREPMVGANRRRKENVPLSKLPMKVGRVSPL